MAEGPQPQAFAKGRECFFRHPEHCWLLGVVENVLGPNEYEVASLEEQFGLGRLVVKGTDMAPVVSGVKDHVRDLLQLPYLHDSALLYHVRRRYFTDHIYTHIGPILLALNPFTYDIPHYRPDQMPHYIREGPGALLGNSSQLPHSWSVAHEAYWFLRTKGEDQAILVSGESGAGKTEAVKIVLRYLATCSTAHASAALRQRVQGIADRVEATSPILEAFGNACTLLNDNSSRFGKFLAVQFDANGHISGAEITSYLLEKSRVVTHGPGERTYHTFYQMLRGATEEERERWHLKDDPQAFGITRGKLVAIAGVDDAAEYRVVRQAMDTMGLSAEDQEAVYRTCAAVLHLSNVQFAEQRDATTVRDPEPLQVAAGLLAVDADALLLSLTQKETALYTTPLTVQQANDCRDALCKALYSGVFTAIIDRLNDLLRAPAAGGGARRGGWIGLLDIFGFEHFERNSFEQLCINLANEQLQSHYNKCVFERDMAEYQAEGLEVDEVMFVDNKPTLDLLVGRLGVFDLLDSECISQHGTDANYLATMERELKNHKSRAFGKPRIGQDCFSIKHYAATVDYHVRGFREKNLDTLPDTLKRVVGQSRTGLIAELLPRPLEPEADDGAGRRKVTAKRIVTVSSSFRASLQELMERILTTNPHWIRCIKPHPCRQPRHFQGASVMEQLQCAGVLETIKIRAAGYSVRMPHSDFVAHYKVIWRAANRPGHTSSAHMCRDVLEVAGCLPAPGASRLDVQIGRKKLFMRNAVFHALEARTAQLQVTNATRTQAFVRSRIAEALLEVRRLHRTERAFYEARETATRTAVEREATQQGWLLAEEGGRAAVAVDEAKAFDVIAVDRQRQLTRLLAKWEEQQLEMQRRRAKEQREREELERQQRERERQEREQRERERREREEREAALRAEAEADARRTLEREQRALKLQLEAEAQALLEAKELEKRELAERLQAEATVALAAKEREAEALREAVEAERQRLEALRQREAEGLRAKAEAEAAALQETHLKKERQWEAALQKERQQWEEEVQALRAKWAADLEDAAEAAARSHKKAALAWEAERGALRSEAELRHAQARQQLQAAAEELEAVRAAHAREAEELWKAVEVEKEEFVAQQRRLLADREEAERLREADGAQQRQLLKAEIDRLTEELQEERRRRTDQLAAEQRQAEAAAAALRADHAAEVAALAQRRAAERQQWEQRQATALSVAAATAAREVEEWASKLEAEQRGRQQQQQKDAALRADLEAEREQLLLQASQLQLEGQAAAERLQAQERRAARLALQAEELQAQLGAAQRAAGERAAAARQEAEQQQRALQAEGAARVAQAKAEASQQLERERDQWQKERDALRQTAERLRGEMDRASERERGRLQAEMLEQLQSARSSHAEKLQAMRRDFDRERDEMAAQHAAALALLKGQLAATAQELEAAEHKAAAERAQAAAAGQERLQAQAAEFEQRLKQLKKERQRLEEQLDEAEGRLAKEQLESRQAFEEEKAQLVAAHERQKRQLRAELHEATAQQAEEHARERERLQWQFEREREDLEAGWRAKLQRSASSLPFLEEAGPGQGEVLAHFQRRLEEFQEAANRRLMDLHRLEASHLSGLASAAAAAAAGGGGREGGAALKHARAELQLAELQNERLQQANEVLKAQVVQYEAELEQEVARSRQQQRQQSQLVGQLQAQLLEVSTASPTGALTLEQLVVYLVGRLKWPASEARSLFAPLFASTRSSRPTSPEMPLSALALDKGTFLRQCTQDGIGLPEAERLFQRLDSGRPDAREPPRLPDPLLDGAGETDGAAGGGFTKEEFIAQCMRDGVERRMAERMFAALDEQNTGFISMEALAPPAPTMAVRLSPAADPRPLPYPIAQATVTLAPTEGFRLVVEALPPGKYRVLLHNASRKTPGSYADVYLRLQPLDPGQRAVLGKWSLNNISGQNRLAQGFETLETGRLDLALVPYPILQRETEIGFDVSGGGPVGASLARHHPKAELEREFRRLTGDDVWPAR